MSKCLEFFTWAGEKPFRLWCLFFSFPSAVALAVQLLVLPHLFPSWHAGNGLLIPPGDWLLFHETAAEIAARIHREGWASLPVFPEGGIHVAIVGALYALTVPKPWVLIPLFAALHASAAFVLFRIVERLFDDRQIAVLSSLPFLLSPTAAVWYSQIHRDGYTILGFFLLVYVWMRIIRGESGTPAVVQAAQVFALGLCALVIMTLGRPYSLQMIYLLSAAFLPLLVVILWNQVSRTRIRWTKAASTVLLAVGLVAIMSPFQRFAIVKDMEPIRSDSGSALTQPQIDVVSPETCTKLRFQWRKSDFLPDFIDARLFTMGYLREGFRLTHPEAATAIDICSVLNSAWEMFQYVPRATQIALFAPFPNTWTGQGSRGPGTLLRKITGGETFVIYLFFLFFCVAAYRLRRRLEFWLISLFCFGALLVHGIVVNNVGTLHRMRYAYLMLLGSVGCAQLLISLVSMHRTKRTAVQAKGNNIDPATVAGFGDEWTRFNQSQLGALEHSGLFETYFTLFPWNSLPANAAGFDLGCGSGRWAKSVAPRVGKLHCVDASVQALDVARMNLSGLKSCEFHHASVDKIPLPDNSMDFGYSLGVLHHVPDTQAGITSCTAKLKPGAPFLLYLYYQLDDRPAWFKAVWKCSDLLRKRISQMPHTVRYGISQVIAGLVYLPLARTALVLEKAGMDVSNVPLSFYRDKSFYTMRTDTLDRFGTRLEQRFTAAAIRKMMESAGLERIEFSDSMPKWCAIGFKRIT